MCFLVCTILVLAWVDFTEMIIDSWLSYKKTLNPISCMYGLYLVYTVCCVYIYIYVLVKIVQRWFIYITTSILMNAVWMGQSQKGLSWHHLFITILSSFSPCRVLGLIHDSFHLHIQFFYLPFLNNKINMVCVVNGHFKFKCLFRIVTYDILYSISIYYGVIWMTTYIFYFFCKD